ncbi:MAG: hypothetical protein H7A40_05715 [Chlamydiales bacterium]|nr:hypothetical protein [Chlamydiales bacterium]
MTNQPTTGMNLSSIPTSALARSVAFLSQAMMGKLQQNAGLLIAALSTLSVNETSLSMSCARSSARDSLAGGISDAIGGGVGGLIQIGDGISTGKEMGVQSKAQKTYEEEMSKSTGSNDAQAAIDSAKAVPETAKENRDKVLNESKQRIKQNGQFASGYSVIAQSLGKVVGSGFNASGQLEASDQKLADQVAAALMQTLNTIVGQVTTDYGQNNPYGALVNLAN